MIWLALLALAWLALLAARRYRLWRDQRDLRIRYRAMHRFCFVPQKGAKRFSQHNEDL